MKTVTPLTAKVWLSPTSGRRYLTKRSAVLAEAKALIKKKYPTERSHTDSFGRIEDPGWHWTNKPRSDVLLRRMCRLVDKATNTMCVDTAIATSKEMGK